MNLFNLGGWFTNIWMDLWISLNSVVYQLIEWLYEIFEAIANVNLFSEEAFNDITSRLYVVIGIAMLFIFAYNIILMIINPDDKKSIGNTSKIVKETVIAFVLVILLPTIFNFMAVFQKNVLDSHILEQIILGDTAGTTVDCDFSELELINSYVNVKSGSATQDMQNHCNTYQNLTASQRGAYLVAPTIFTAFFHPSNYGYDECVNYLTECKGQGSGCNSSDGLITTDDDKELCAYYVYDTNIGQFKGGIANFVTDDGVYSSAWSDKGIFDFNYLMAFAAGILGVWMFICYAMAIGVRVAKLGFFQIISPIPVMLRIIPKQKEAFYDKWFKHLVDAYLDVFIRLAIIYFCLFAISLVPDVMDSLFASLTGNIFTKALATVIVILGILKFAQEAPALLKEFFGNSGKFALRSPAKQLKDNMGANAFRGAVYGATTGKGWGRVGGLFSGAARGAVGGYDKAVKGLDMARTERENGSTLRGRLLDRTMTAFGMETRAEGEDRLTNNLNERMKINTDDSKKLKDIKDIAENAIKKDNSKIKFAGFSFEGKYFADATYSDLQEYESELRAIRDNATNATDRARASAKLDRYKERMQNLYDAKTNEAINALIAEDDFGGAFYQSDLATVKANIAEVVSHEHKDEHGNKIASISNADDIKNTMNTLGKDSKNISNEISDITTRSGYKARHADSRVVRGNGKSEKK